MTSPLPAALTGVVAAVGLTLLRARLRRGSSAGPGERTLAWRPADVVVVLLAVGVALIARLPWLEARPLDNDEPVGLGLASLADWARERDARLHPPLPALLMTWAGGAGEIARARSVSVLAGVASVALVFAVVRAAAGRGPAALAALWLGLMPAAVHTSQLARGYALCALGVLAAHACLTKALATGEERWFLAYSLAVAATLLSEYLAFAPILVSALAALPGRSASLRIGIVGGLGAGLALVAFLAPVALPTLTLGVGGGPHAPTGAWRALGDALALFSGPAAPFNALLALALIVSAARRRALAGPERIALWALGAATAVLLLAAELTAVRARYLLHVVPLFVCVVATSARSLGRLGVGVAAFVALGHAGLLPAYYVGAIATEASTGRRAPVTLALLEADPNVPVAVVPAHALGEPSWRLARAFPGRDAGLACPAELCVRGRRVLYGTSAARLSELLAREPRLYVWQRDDALLVTPGCGALVREAGSTLWLCTLAR